MSTINWPDDSALEPFSIFEETYKIVSSHEIKAAILIPKDLRPGQHPAILNLHGGFFATGHSIYAPFFSSWALALAVDHSAIIISADYRLLPSANGIADLLEDLEDFWQWAKSKLPEVLERHAPGHSLNYSQLLLVGNSAGGYCAAQLALSHPDEISALAMPYPCLDLKDDLFVKGPGPGDPTVLRFPVEEIPSKQDALAWVEERRRVLTTKDGFESIPFCVSLCQNGLFASKVLDNRSLELPKFLPLERIKAGAKLPKHVWVIHGDDDSTVHIRGSNAFAGLIKSELPDTTLRYDIARGHDHGFDFEPSYWKLFSASALEFVVKAWLS